MSMLQTSPHYYVSLISHRIVSCQCSQEADQARRGAVSQPPEATAQRSGTSGTPIDYLVMHRLSNRLDVAAQEKRNRTEFLRRYAKSFLLKLYDFSDPYTAMDLLLHSLSNERAIVVRKLLRARERADRVRNEFLQVKASILRSGADEHECDRRLDVFVIQVDPALPSSRWYIPPNNTLRVALPVRVVLRVSAQGGGVAAVPRAADP